MEHLNDKPSIFHIQRNEALEVQTSSFGSVGKHFSGEGIEKWTTRLIEIPPKLLIST